MGTGWRDVPESDAAGLSPANGFHTAAAACLITYISALLSLSISHRWRNSEIQERREVVAVSAAGRLVMLVVALFQTLAAINASIAAAAVLG